MEVIAHRGIHNNNVRENSRNAIIGLLDSRADGIEVDIRITRDGVCILHHDTTLSSRIRVSKRTLCELQERDPDLLSVPEALGILKEYKGIINLEVKHLFGELDRSRGIACIEQLVRDIECSEVDNNRIILSSFSLSNVMKMNKHVQDIALSYLLPPGVRFSRALQRIDEYGCTSVHLSVSHLQKKRCQTFINQVHDNGYKVRVYTVNNKYELMRAQELGVDGIFTDYVDEMKAQIHY